MITTERSERDPSDEPFTPVQADIERAAQVADRLPHTIGFGRIRLVGCEHRPIGDGRIGPIAQQLRDALTAEIGLDFAAQAASYAARGRPAARSS